MRNESQIDRIIVLISLLLMVWGIPDAFCSTPALSLQKSLAEARENLRISRASEEKIETELSRLKQSGTAPERTIRDYEDYLVRVQALVRENDRKVRELEALQAKYGIGNTRAPSAWHDPPPAYNVPNTPNIPEASINDPVAALDRELDQSLAAFDMALLKEMELIKIQSDEKIQELRDEAEAARQRLKEQGIDIDAPDDREAEQTSSGKESDNQTDKQEESQAKQDQNGEPGSNASTDKDREGTGVARGETGGPAEGVGGMSREEERRYGRGEDDDIVARQLREAAQNETDPVLREKLWKEYEDYKKNK